MYSPLTTSALRAAPRRTQLLATKTPVSMPAQALETSIGVACLAPIADATETLIGGSSQFERPSRYFVMLPLITRSICSGSPSHLDRQSSAAPTARVKESSAPVDTRRSWMPVSRSRSTWVLCRVDAMSSDVVRWVGGSDLPTLANRATCGARSPSAPCSFMSQLVIVMVRSLESFVSNPAPRAWGQPGPNDPATARSPV